MLQKAKISDTFIEDLPHKNSQRKNEHSSIYKNNLPIDFIPKYFYFLSTQDGHFNN